MNLIVIICLIALIESRKLTTEENEKRLEVCGLTGKPKVFNGRPTKSSEAPWSVMVMTKKGDEEGGFCTGTILSPRHILSATHCAATGDENEWTHTDVKFPSPKEKCGEHNNLIVTEVAASRVHVRTRNLTELGRAKFLHMFQFCRVVNKGEYEVQYADDIMIIELADDIEYSENVQPACTASALLRDK
ncbi:CRE-TRY-6 protein [Caenorhabditis remanei]|uniref:CRE-TRY-6 protein n=1 Tax=Caenorhabditis remanei TaxID=31234 RepID=E3N963_CAERE|nr:CRE-TRY-6 protein [Caenorhabditis remanei]